MKYIIYNTYRHHIVSLLISILNYQNNQNNTKRGTHYSTQLHLRNKMAARTETTNDNDAVEVIDADRWLVYSR